MEHIDILQEMLQYIDAHIKEEMSVEKLAERAGFSPYYFCRVFQCGVGSSIMEYVRNRRLAYAASELNSRRKILHIAIDYGFETHSGFSKAFRRYFGCSPEIYRAYAAFNVPKIPDLSKSNQFMSELVIDPKIMIKKKSFKLAGFTFKIKLPLSVTITKNGHIYHNNYKTIPKLWDECRTDGRLEKLDGESFVKFHAKYGAYLSKDYENSKCIYFIGVEVKSKITIPFKYDVYTIPETLFAVFTIPPSNRDNFPSTINDTWQFIFSEWLPNSGYEFDDNSIAFELYDDRSTGDTGKVCNICIPIINRQL
jgi:AraC family transcriptional regulator